jgi:mono/diheme cytochrome c family protein
MLRLPAAPAALVGLAAAGGDLGERAAKVLARVEWPGKPGAQAAVAPLTPQQQAWFDTGETVFKNLCQACHQADGRGQDRVAANLVGSAFALGPAEIGARILLNGKEGKIGLMPPLGTALTDDQIAGALTYVRRQWGNAASAIDPAIVRQIRSLTAGRTKPWTDDELSALLK